MTESHTIVVHFPHIKCIDQRIDASLCRRLLIITDLHISQTIPFEKACGILDGHVKSLVEKTNPQMIIILGDILHYTRYKPISSWCYFFEMLEKHSISTYIIPGNHDRRKAKQIETEYTGKYVHFICTELLRVIYSGDKSPIVFGHDLHNDNKAHGTEFIRQWMGSLRQHFSVYIPQDSYFICGHTHEFFASEDGHTLTIQPFSCDLKNYSFGLIDFAEGEQAMLHCGEMIENTVVMYNSLSEVPSHNVKVIKK